MTGSASPVITSGAPDKAPALPPATATIVLTFPMTVAGVPTNKITMRRPKVRDRIAVAKTDPDATSEEQEVRFLANLCDLLPEDIEGMDFIDYNKMQKQLRDFQSSAPSKT